MQLTDYLKSERKTYLIFDFDETLFKLILPWDHCLDYIQEELKKLDKNILRDFEEKRLNLSETQNAYISKYGQRVKKLIYSNNTQFETKQLKGVLLNKELLEFILTNKEYKLFIWSSNTSVVINKILDQYKIFNKFQKIVTRLDVDLIKPEIEGFELINKPSISTNNYLFIGDSDSDEKAAKRLDMDFFFVDYFRNK
ncbi:HAD-IA family hydrolase [Candidatus Roizmanbacteria bacterium]|nr:HAD-IA family hydrolase [Candidatus Roizmanbacteria bacterium]